MRVQGADSRLNLIGVLLIGAAMLLGGGGSPAPLPEMILQLIGLAALCAWVFLAPGTLPAVDRQAWLFVGLLFLLPAIQLVPLPPALWQSLPGRDVEQAALGLVGADDTWRPWSVAPDRTLASLLALTTPAIMLIFTAAMPRGGRTMIVAAIAGLALLSLLVGTAQMTGGDQNALRFYVRDMAYLNGFQANHNSAADVLLIGMVAFAAAVREWRVGHGRAMVPHYRLGMVGGATAIFSLGVYLTASRAGVFLLPVAWLAVLALVWPWLGFSRKTWFAIAAAGGLALVGAAIVIHSSGVIARVASRYEFAGEFRPQLWRDALFAAQQYLPWGAGAGTFVPVFMAAERLEVVDPSVPNRAHNEILELLIEGGFFSALLLAAALFIIARRSIAGLRQPPAGSAPQVVLAIAILVLVALHSQVDYPLRSISLACIAAVAAGLLMPLSRISGSQIPVAGTKTTRELK